MNGSKVNRMQDVPDQVIAQAAAGDVASFETIFKSYADYVYNVALRVVRSREDAQEITQDVFIAVFKRLKDFQFRSHLKTWLYRITVNMAINYAKKETPKRSATVEYIDEIIPGKQSPDCSDAQGLVDYLFSFLTPEQRVCLVLRSGEGLSYEEIAQTLNININSVRSRIKRAREKLLTVRKEVMADEL
jgi:RNA polymerase sigma-70 factor, ECF subfamily